MSDDARAGDGGVGRGPDAGSSPAGDALVISAGAETDPEQCEVSLRSSRPSITCSARSWSRGRGSTSRVDTGTSRTRQETPQSRHS